ncbi:MAG: tetratricopeptide repeat protein [Deltaproteobacteria bacterium]|nr:tetratricopeptide repeat protein [Deltaproteobacteria bacterium]
MTERIDIKQTGDPRREIAEQYLKEGRLQEAIGVYRELVNEYPDQDSYLLALAWACHDAGQIDAAVGCFDCLLEKELARNVFTGFAFDELVRIFKKGRQFDRLVALCEKAVARYPGDAGLLGELGQACLAAGDPGRAAGAYKRLIALDPDDPVFFCCLGDALLAARNPEGAEEAYRRAVELDADTAGGYYSKLAEGLLQVGAEERAEKVLRKCLECSPEESLYHLLLGDCLLRRKKLEEGEDQYEQAVKMNPASAGVYYNRLGNAFARARHHRRAAECFRKAIAADPSNTFYQVRLAEACAAARDSDPAKETAGRTDQPD